MKVIGSFENVRLAPQEEVLIVGGEERHYPEWIRRHPRVTVWCGDSLKRAVIPKWARLIILTQMIDHKVSQRVKKLAAGIPQLMMVAPLISTQEVRRILPALLGESVELSSGPEHGSETMGAPVAQRGGVMSRSEDTRRDVVGLPGAPVTAEDLADSGSVEETILAAGAAHEREHEYTDGGVRELLEGLPAESLGQGLGGFGLSDALAQAAVVRDFEKLLGAFGNQIVDMDNVAGTILREGQNMLAINAEQAKKIERQQAELEQAHAEKQGFESRVRGLESEVERLRGVVASYHELRRAALAVSEAVVEPPSL